MVERAGWAVGGLAPIASALIIAVSALGLTATSAGSQVRPTPVPDPDPDVAARAITQTVTAAEVADWARRRRDARAMIVAARMLGEVQRPRAEGEEPFLTQSILLNEAAAFAGGDRALLDEISRIRSPDKGVRASPFGPGPIVVVRRLRARETYGFTIDARRHEVLRVAAIGDGDTNIDLTLRDQNGAVLCADGSGDHYPVCTVNRPQGGPIRVEIVNRGEVWSRVQILTN